MRDNTLQKFKRIVNSESLFLVFYFSVLPLCHSKYFNDQKNEKIVALLQNRTWRSERKFIIFINFAPLFL